jgi:hypothetical protein
MFMLIMTDTKGNRTSIKYFFVVFIAIFVNVHPFGDNSSRAFARSLHSFSDKLSISSNPEADSFPIVTSGQQAAQIIYSERDFKVVAIAANDLSADIERVTGRKPAVYTDTTKLKSAAIFIGTLGHSAVIDALIQTGKLDTGPLEGQWECFVIAIVDEPLPDIEKGLVIAGSDRRGTAFGVYELSQAIGVSPWYWWADVTPVKKSALYVTAGTHFFGPPSVKYRGIFINDEDWGLQPWAAKTFEPELGDIGPKTYAKVFELLLRLKANTLWPAMHQVTKAFNLYPENKIVADEYAIIMASSHAEPMLRNNVTEWTAPHEDFDYAKNPDGVLAYWEQRVAENGRFENIYTIGMRGIHDSGMVGVRKMEEKIALLERIFADQRGLLAKYVNPDVTKVPQAFTPYKEVLDIYQAGLKVPDDVTIVWPDDNHGYIRYYPTAQERERSGGFGVYYHLSYLGAPMAYLWLYTTPPSLVWEEMYKAYEHGVRTLWIANVGDIKPAEIGMDFFLQMAWNIEKWRLDNLPEFLVEWASREFGAEYSVEIAGVMSQYYRLNYQRRPEHLQWWLPNQRVRSSDITPEEIQQRLAAFDRLSKLVEGIQKEIPESKHDAFFELVYYPVMGAALANKRVFHTEEYNRLFNENNSAARQHGARARAADAKLAAITRRYNEDIARGKWRHIMAVEPADSLWRSFRMTPPILPAENMVAESIDPDFFEQSSNVTERQALHQSGTGQVDDVNFVELDGVVSIEAEHFTNKIGINGIDWEVIEGLGRTGDSVAIFPTTALSVDESNLVVKSPRLEYQIDMKAKGDVELIVNLIPTHPVRDGHGLRLAVAFDEQAPQIIVVDCNVGDSVWAQSVLSATITGSIKLHILPGTHILKVYMVDPGVVLDKIVIDCGGLKPSYLGPPETIETEK